jgi:hypothetical protein
MSRPPSPRKTDYLALALVSCAALSYEVVLLRVFSFSQWHHFAAMAVSLALLGFGAAGTLLALLGQRAVRWGDRLFMAGLLISAAGMIGCSVLPQFISVRPLFAVWDARELGKLLLLDFAAFIPFFGAAVCIGQVFIRWPESTRRLYGVNLLGSGMGALLATVLLAGLLLEKALVILPMMMLAAGIVTAIPRKRIRMAGLLCLAGMLCLAGWMVKGPAPLPLSDFKRLAYLLDFQDSEVLERRPGLEAETTIIRSGSIRPAPGLSLEWPDAVAPRDALLLGSDRVVPLPRESGPSPHFKATLAALPFLLRDAGPVAVLGSSEWLVPTDVPGRQPAWVENHAGIARAYLDRGLLDPEQVHKMHPRRFLETASNPYAIIYLSGSYNAGDATSEDYVLTSQAIEAALDALAPDGLLAIPLRLNNPPRYAPKLMSVIEKSLHNRDVAVPFHHFVLLRSMQEGLFIVSRESLKLHDVQSVRAFAGQWGFDIAALPGLARDEANRFHILEKPVFFETAMAVFGNTGSVPPEAGWYLQDPPADDKPYFWHSMKWRNTPALLREFGRQGLTWLDWSLLASVIKLLVAAALALLLILLPLGRLPSGHKPITRSRICLYFTALGLGFLLLEMAAFQRCLLYLDEPVVTAAVVFSVFLVGAGLGSLTSPAIRDRGAAALIFPMILATAALAFLLLRFGLDAVHGMPMGIRIAAIATSLAPLAWSLGQAFPWGLRQLDEDRQFIPWAWGINGFASVIAAPTATLLSVHLGQPATWLAGALCYVVALAVARTWVKQWNWYG